MLDFGSRVDYQQPSKLRKNDYVLENDIIYQLTSQPKLVKGGKHGHAKYLFDARNIVTGKKKVFSFNGHEQVTIPTLKSVEYEVCNVEDDRMDLLDDLGNLFDEVKIPSTELGDKINEEFKNNKEGLKITLRGFKSFFMVVSTA